MSHNAKITCKNCETNFYGHYCPNCKQSSKTGKITWHEMFHYIFHAFSHLDKGIFYTAKEMFLHPGKTIHDYIDGKRVRHFNPLLFLILLGGMASLLFTAFDVGAIQERLNTESIEKINPLFAHKHYTIIGFVILIFLTITDFVFYRKHGYSIPELLVSNAFQIGELLIFLIFMLPFLYFQNYINARYQTNIELRYFILIVFYFYLFWVRHQLYGKIKTDYVLLLKIVLQLILLCVIVQYRIAKPLIDAIPQF
ncbi:DUF3667 domain-containing protein [Flavobacterium fluviatile]|uniref:DUF3667 domain-containing protein n=1 Tax=Flavobacterium fluviatile TaxID=1862387 RepID=UPI0013D36F70|nr:DUF3667 domain-containing protein [Flavobacterium fluviatile]